MNDQRTSNPAIDILRWLALIPLALCASWASFILMRLLGKFSFGYAGISPESIFVQIYETALGHGVMGGVFVYVGCYVAPSHLRAISIVCTVIAVAIAGFMLFPAVMVNDWWAVAGSVAMTVGAAIMLWSFLSGEIRIN